MARCASMQSALLLFKLPATDVLYLGIDYGFLSAGSIKSPARPVLTLNVEQQDATC